MYSTKQFSFGAPSMQKELDAIFIEGYIAPNTTITMSLLLDDDGYTGSYNTEFSGTEDAFQFDVITLNTFGVIPFGILQFGANDDTTGLRKFRVYLNKKFLRIPFYNCQLQFGSTGEGQRWEILRYGFLVRQHSQPIRTSLMRNFN